MNTYNFIPDDIFDKLPDDRGEQFEKLLEVARAQYELAITDRLKDTRDQITVAFMSQIKAIAQELGVGSVRAAVSTPILASDWTKFESDLASIRTKRRLRRDVAADKDSVELSRVTKFRIEQEVERLRGLIKSSDISSKTKKALNQKLDELLEELHRKRLSFAKLAAVAAAIAGVLGGTSATLANGPEAIETIGRILHWVGEEKAAEEHEQLKLAAPLKALPAPSDSKEQTDSAD